jgi:2-C-methyl-D-erythritol 4-phosphate cytidylyltransferase
VVVAGSARALIPVAGVPMVVRAVRALVACGLVDHVTVLAGGAHRSEVERVCVAEPVSVRAGSPLALHGVGAHIGQRVVSSRSDGLVTAGIGDVVLLHDACRPLAPAALAAAVVDAVRDGHDMAVPVLPLSDTVKQVDDQSLVTGTPDRSGLRVLQTPFAARSALLPTDIGDDPLGVVRRHTAAGAAVHTVAGHPAAFAVHSAWDLELAELVAEGTISL